MLGGSWRNYDVRAALKVVKSLRRTPCKPLDMARGKRVGGAVQRGGQPALFLGETRRSLCLNRVGNSRKDLGLVAERRGVNQVAVPGPTAQAGPVEEGRFQRHQRPVRRRERIFVIPIERLA